MYIYELELNTPITITAKMRGSNQLEWKREVMRTSIKQKHILVPLLTYQKKVVSFNVAGVIIEVTAVGPDGPVVFKNCSVRSLVVSGVRYHEIVCRVESVNGNRRASDRIDMKCPCTIYNQHFRVEGVLKDLGASGFSCVIDGDLEPNMNQQSESITIEYTDTKLKRDIAINGTVVRRVKLKDGSVLYGCTLEMTNDVMAAINTRK